MCSIWAWRFKETHTPTCWVRLRSNTRGTWCLDFCSMAWLWVPPLCTISADRIRWAESGDSVLLSIWSSVLALGVSSPVSSLTKPVAVYSSTIELLRDTRWPSMRSRKSWGHGPIPSQWQKLTRSQIVTSGFEQSLPLFTRESICI